MVNADRLGQDRSIVRWLSREQSARIDRNAERNLQLSEELDHVKAFLSLEQEEVAAVWYMSWKQSGSATMLSK